jgi:fimbrial isopeptide formation D2 family protein/uncharacterized repeat protein (TIGR01451 family)
VRSFIGENNQAGQNLYYPESNIDSTVTSGEENASAADDSADVTTAAATVTKTATTSITTAGNGEADATIGEAITYTIEVTVPHDTTFYNASLADPLGSRQTYVTGSGQVTLGDGTEFGEGSSAEGFTYAYDSSSNTVTLSFPSTYPNPTTTDEQVTVVFSTVVADVAANARNDEISNVATLSDDTAPSGGSLVTAANTPLDTLVVEPDVTIAKSVSPAKIQPGGTNTFTITVTNPNLTGVSSAFDLVGTDTIPSGLSYVDSSAAFSPPSSGSVSESGDVISWSIPELDPGDTDTITYEVNPPAPADMTTGESFTNTATLTSWDGVSGDPAGTRTYGPASASVDLPAEFPDLVTTKSTPDGNAAFANQPFSWKVSVKNSTTVAIANSLAVTDTLPADWTYDTGTTTFTPPTGPATHPDPTVTVNGSGDDVLTWTDLGTLNPGQTLTIVYEGIPGSDLDTVATTGPDVPYTNSAYATADDSTGASGNETGQYQSNTATASAYIGDADLQIVKSHSGDFSAGADGIYTLTVRNNGPSAAGTPITVSDTMVSPEEFVSATGSGWACTYSSPTVTCTSSTTLASGATAPAISVVVDTPSSTADGTDVTNTASVTSPTWDSDTANNTSSDPTTIDAKADLAITKSHTGSFTAGSQGTYTISIENNGPSDAVGPLSVTDTLPTGETLVSATGTGWSCGAVSGGQFTCTNESGLTSGSFAQPITEVVDVAASQAPGSMTNTASVSSSTSDPVPGNNTSNDATTVVTSADLTLSKVHEGTFVAGDDGTYDFTVSNSEGPSDAAGPLTVTDTLPSGETFVSGGGSGWSCSVSSGTVTCTTSSGLDVGGSTSFTMTVAIASSVTVSSLTNTATVSSPTSDPVSSNNTSTDNAGTTQTADLQVVKSLTSSLVAGQDATYSLAVTDNGPSDAAGPVTLTDTLPSGESYVSGTGTGWSCASSAATVTCTHSASIAAGGANETTVTLTVALTSDVLSQSISNTASVSSSTPDPDAGNNTSTTTDTSSTSADLRITKSDVGPFTAGTDGDYSIAVSNAGPSDAQEPIAVTDTLPSGETYLGATGSGWSCSASGQTVSCDDDVSLVAGAAAPTLGLSVAVSPSLTSAHVTNDASVSSPTSDPDGGNNSTTDTTAIDTSADLAITKTHTGDFTAGSDGTYTLTDTNNGPSDAALPLTVTDPVPSPFTLVSASGGGAWDCTVSGNEASCAAVAVLPAGSAAPAISVVVTSPSSQAATTVTNTASVSSATHDPDSENNSSSDSTTIVTSADLWLTKAHQGTFTAGTEGSYLIAVGNLGPSDAAEPVTVTDTLPASETFGSATGTGWSCSDDLQVVTCTDSANLPSGESAADIDLSVAIASGATGSITNTATVSSPTTDPATGNNSGSDTATLAYRADLSITKSHTGDFTAGLDGTYTLDFHDAGPSDSGTGVVVADTLPSGESFVSGEGTGWSCTEVHLSVTCTLATPVAVTGDAPPLTLVVAVGSGAVGTLTNVAQVEGPNPDPDLSNNTASDPTTSDRSFALSLTKSLDGPLQDRSDATYALAVSNAGPSDSVSPVTVTDPLPAGLTFVSSTSGTGGAWSCAAGGATVTCIDGTPVAAATTSTVDITVMVSAPVGSTIANTATAEATGDVGAAEEIGSVDGIVTAAAPVPDSGASGTFGAGSSPPLVALLLVVAGLALAIGAQRRRRRARVG